MFGLVASPGTREHRAGQGGMVRSADGTPAALSPSRKETVPMRTSSFTLNAITLLTLSIGLVACDDISTQAPKPQPTPAPVGEAPKAIEVPVPPTVAATTPGPKITTDTKKEEPIV